MKARFLIAAFAAATVFAAGARAQQTMPPQLSFQAQLPPSGVQSVQHQLRQSGFYQGRVDGVWGPDSVSALQRFQQAHGLQITGQLNQATAATLGLDPDAVLGMQQVPAVAQNESGHLSSRAVIAVQRRLEGLGFYRGQLDGVWGPSTQEAIARFQQSRGLQPNSQLNPATVASLGLPSEVLAGR